MSQNTRKQPGEQGKSGRTSGVQHDRQQYEGFEGMNYEQRREPFQHQQSRDRERDPGDGRKEQRQDQP